MKTPPLPLSHLLYCPRCYVPVTPVAQPDFKVFCTVCGTHILTVVATTMPFGKYKGELVHRMNSVEQQRYLKWFLENIADIQPVLRALILMKLDLILEREVPVPMWATTLGIKPPVTTADVNRAYRTLAKDRHPDVGGSVQLMQELNQAKEQALAACAA